MYSIFVRGSFGVFEVLKSIICKRLESYNMLTINVSTSIRFQFDLWTDAQRRRFLDVLFQQCNRPTYKFVQQWFQENVPMQHLDFTTVLPKLLSMYIFSFLDPRSLCKCAEVSWHWKFLSEQVQLILFHPCAWIFSCLFQCECCHVFSYTKKFCVIPCNGYFLRLSSFCGILRVYRNRRN